MVIELAGINEGLDIKQINQWMNEQIKGSEK